MLAEVAHTLSNYVRWSRVRARLERLRAAGFIQDVPDRWQLLLAGRDMMLGTTSDETRIWYEQRQIAFTAHNIRRFLDHPAAMMDPVGFFSSRDTILHHVFQTAHTHPVYDFQLLAMFPDGIAELQRRAHLVADGTDLDQARLAVLVEEDGYHARLAVQVAQFAARPLLRAPSGTYDHATDPLLAVAMDQFKDTAGLCSYAARIDAGPWRVLVAYGSELWKATFGRFGPRRPVVPDHSCFSTELLERHGIEVVDGVARATGYGGG